MFDQYFTDSQHRFMSAVSDTLIACGWDDQEAFDIGSEVLDDWEHVELNRLDELKAKQAEVTKEWLYMSKSDNPIDIQEAKLLFTRSRDLTLDIIYLQDLIKQTPVGSV